MMEINKIYLGSALDVLKTFPNESIDCVVTSPPYWSLRDYGVDGQLGLESTCQEYISKLCGIFDEIMRVLKKDGTVFVNLGDTYSGNKEGKTDEKVCQHLKDTSKNIHKKKGLITEKSLCQVPSRFAIEMCNRGWILRNEIIWHKPNCMPSSVNDRFTVDFERIFFFTKSKKYHFEPQKELSRSKEPKWGNFSNPKYNVIQSSASNSREGMTPLEYAARYKYRNKRCVWTINTKPFREAHFATFPESLVETPIRAGCPIGGIVCDPFFGSGTTGLVALKNNRNFIGIELQEKYIEIANKRLKPFLDQKKIENFGEKT